MITEISGLEFLSCLLMSKPSRSKVKSSLLYWACIGLLSAITLVATEMKPNNK